MSTINPFIEKQLIIGEILNKKGCYDLRHDIKNYLFIDTITAESHRRKRLLIDGLNYYLDRLDNQNNESHWYISYGFEVQFQAVQCSTCGGFQFVNGDILPHVAHRALCSCDGYAEYYQQQIAYLNQPLQIFM